MLSIPISKHKLILVQASRLSWYDLYSSQAKVIIILFTEKLTLSTNISYYDIKFFYFQLKIQQNFLTPIGSYIFEESSAASLKINLIIYYVEFSLDRMYWLRVWNNVKIENSASRS